MHTPALSERPQLCSGNDPQNRVIDKEHSPPSGSIPLSCANTLLVKLEDHFEPGRSDVYRSTNLCYRVKDNSQIPLESTIEDEVAPVWFASRLPFSHLMCPSATTRYLLHILSTLANG